MSYPTTPTSSVDAAHDRSTCRPEAAVAVSDVGIEGAVTSGIWSVSAGTSSKFTPWGGPPVGPPRSSQPIEVVPSDSVNDSVLDWMPSSQTSTWLDVPL